MRYGYRSARFGTLHSDKNNGHPCQFIHQPPTRELIDQNVDFSERFHETARQGFSVIISGCGIPGAVLERVNQRNTGKNKYRLVQASAPVNRSAGYQASIDGRESGNLSGRRTSRQQ